MQEVLKAAAFFVKALVLQRGVTSTRNQELPALQKLWLSECEFCLIFFWML